MIPESSENDSPSRDPAVSRSKPLLPIDHASTLERNDPTDAILHRWLELLGRAPGASVRRAEDRWLNQLLPTICNVMQANHGQIISQLGLCWEPLAIYRDVAGDDAVARSLDSLIETAVDANGPVSKHNLYAAVIHRGGESLEALGTSALRSEHPSVGDVVDNTVANLSPPTILILRFNDLQMPEGASRSAPRDLHGHRVNQLSRVASLLSQLDRLQQGQTIIGDTAMHLRQLLDLSIRWATIDDTDSLLESIAASAAELLNAERSSIFLWERKRGKLVGRPALGVEGGKLEVDDSAGIVGTVLASGKSRVWNASEDSESEVNRTVDRKLKFQTRSLVAVPLRSPTGTMLGVFEVINKRAGKFNGNDALRLIDLARHAAAAIQGTQARQRLTTVRDRLLQDAALTCQVIGNSPAIRSLRETVTRVAKTELAVLALGENGTGKEVLARSIHLQSHRRDQPFVAVNCAALVESLLESELFGHERGAFTDAVQARPGKFELASGGTLFLDEIGDMSPGGQAKLLRVLEEKLVVRVGGSTPIPVDVRIIAATNQSLPDLVKAKRFREDLFFRLNVVSFRLPPLRERGDDIVLLAEHFIAQFSSQIGRMPLTFSPDARRALMQHRWPGNVRELRNVMERACYLAPEDVLTEADLGLTTWYTGASNAAISSGDKPADRLSSTNPSIGTDATLSDATREFQINHIDNAIQQARGNMTIAAESLGLHRSNLYRKMKQLGMKTEDDQE